MGNKKNKFAFGIFQDGLTIKIAELVSIDNSIKILRLSKTELSAPLYPKVTDTIQEEFAALEDLKKEAEPNLDELKEIHELDELELPGTIDEEKITAGPDIEMSEVVPDFGKEEVPSGLNDLQILLQTFPLEKGKIAINANDEQVSYYQFDSAFATTKLDKKLREELLSKDEIKSKNYSMDYIINPNETGLAFVHRGRFELLDAIQDLNTIISREKYVFSHIDTNELALMNLIRNCYEFPPEDYVTVLYMGIDYIVGIVLRDNNHIKTFPIIITETDPEKKRMAIYSKIILEQDISNTPITQHVILAGENVSNEDVDFFQKKGFYWDPPKRLELSGIEIVEGEDERLNAERIAQYAIPISLAWKVLDPKNTSFFPSNLLPAKIIESQKYFKIAWHGFLVLAAIFYFALSGTIKNLELKQAIVNIQSDINKVQTELRHTRRMIEQVNEVKANMDILQRNIQKVQNIIGTKNQWHYILKDFSYTLRNNKLTWIDQMVSFNDYFAISGYTTRRRNIIELAKLFRNSTIKQIIANEIESVPIWYFDVDFGYPDPEEVARLSKIRKMPDLPRAFEPYKYASPEMEITQDEITIIYNNIIIDYFAGNVQNALNQFNKFIADYPDHIRAYNAKYFVGECQYRLGNMATAIGIFKEIIDLKGSKTPDALMMLGNSYAGISDQANAEYYWDKLINSYPENSLAKLARYRLDQLRG
ncbi:MAG: tetratricopeptide repeat protein [Candidatus Cloacimonetes bacterium]|nr:tetratricopeptide repeat protein [Candidatus Cloacimonadota bacterium]